MEKLNRTDMDKHIKHRYENTINYYWKSSITNKRWYKITRLLTVIVGASVTLIASLTSSTIIAEDPIIQNIFSIGTPILAAILTIIAGFSQIFQWGSSWQNMVLTAQQLQKEYDKYLVTPENSRNYIDEMEKLNNFILTESEGFFERMLGSPKSKSKAT